MQLQNPIHRHQAGGGWQLLGPQPGETQSRVMLVFLRRHGRETGKFKFPHNVPFDANAQLIATHGLSLLDSSP